MTIFFLMIFKYYQNLQILYKRKVIILRMYIQYSQLKIIDLNKEKNILIHILIYDILTYSKEHLNT